MAGGGKWDWVGEDVGSKVSPLLAQPPWHTRVQESAPTDVVDGVLAVVLVGGENEPPCVGEDHVTAQAPQLGHEAEEDLAQGEGQHFHTDKGWEFFNDVRGEILGKREGRREREGET